MAANSTSFNNFLALLLALSGALSQPAAAQSDGLQLTPDQQRWLGQRVYQNECGGRPACLLHWNEGEAFPSLGIGHFIWYPEAYQGPFSETFPELLKRMQQSGIPLPGWLHPDSPAPWSSRQQFLDHMGSSQHQDLYALLESTKPTQAAFIADRLQQEKPLMLQHAAAEGLDSTLIASRFDAISRIDPPRGLFALIDYLHFKGSGTNPLERYQGQGWGLLQVLANMTGDPADLDSFIRSAKEQLSQRVRLAPAERNEQRWLQGWLNRIESYRSDFTAD
jgi:hypothetical protein